MNQNPIIKALRDELANEGLSGAAKYEDDADQRFAYYAGHEAATTRLLPLISNAVTIIELCDKWFQEIYPKEVFIGGPNADEGVNRVVEMREKAREFLTTLADASGEIGKESK